MKITDEAVNKHKPTAIELLNELKCRMDNPPKPDLEELRLMCDEVIAALPYLQAGYKVKQLEWFKVTRNAFRAETVFGAYVINSHVGGDFYWSLPGVLIRRSQSVVEAKAAAQADFERRVHDCIVNGVDVAEVREDGFREGVEASATLYSVQKDYWKNKFNVGLPDLSPLIRALSSAPTEEEGQ